MEEENISKLCGLLESHIMMEFNDEVEHRNALKEIIRLMNILAPQIIIKEQELTELIKNKYGVE